MRTGYLPLTFAPRVQPLRTSTQRAGSLPGPHPSQALDFSMCLLRPMKLSKACIRHQDRKVASSIKKLLILLSYHYSHNLKATKNRKRPYSGSHRNQKLQLLLWALRTTLRRLWSTQMDATCHRPCSQRFKASEQSPEPLLMLL